MRENTIDSLLAQVSIEDDDIPENVCWFWQGRRCAGGYGQVSMARKFVMVHRVIYEFFRGPIPAGLTLDHLCVRRNCVNPNHLDPVPHIVNCRRGPQYGTHKTHCLRGHPYSGDNLKLTKLGRYRCRECSAEKSRRWYARQRLKATVPEPPPPFEGQGTLPF